jgi:hypothetical protein
MEDPEKLGLQAAGDAVGASKMNADYYFNFPSL